MNALKSLIYVEMNRSVSILQVTTFPHIPSSLLFVELLIICATKVSFELTQIPFWHHQVDSGVRV